MDYTLSLFCARKCKTDSSNWVIPYVLGLNNRQLERHTHKLLHLNLTYLVVTYDVVSFVTFRPMLSIISLEPLV